MNDILQDLKNLLTLDSWRLQEGLKFLIERLEAEPKEVSKQRTLKQNSSLHLGLTFIARHLNEIGKDMKATLKPTVDIWWSMESAKEYLFRPIMKAHTTKESTADLDKHEVSECWDIMMKFLGENHGVEYIPFPAEETKINKEQDMKNEANQLREEIEDYPQSEGEVKF